MRIVEGRVSRGSGAAATNFKIRGADSLIAEKMGLPPLHPGTLNVHTETEFPFGDQCDAFIPESEYNGREWIKLKRCRIRGVRCILVRPKDHERVGKFKHRIEIMSPYALRKRLDLAEGDKLEVELEGDEDWWNAPEPV